MGAKGQQLGGLLLTATRSAQRFAVQGNGFVRLGNQRGLDPGRQHALQAISTQPGQQPLVLAAPLRHGLASIAVTRASRRSDSTAKRAGQSASHDDLVDQAWLPTTGLNCTGRLL